MRGFAGLSTRSSVSVFVAVCFVLLARSSGAAEGGAGAFEVLEPGLEFGTFPAPQPADAGDSIVRIVRIDPARYQLRLLNASATPDGERLTARQWAKREGLVAAINASLYQADHRTSVSLMVTRGHVNNRRVSKDNAVLAFDRLGEDLPAVQIIDRTCQDFDSLRERYETLVQGIRMLSCERKNVWRQQPGKWSTAAIGTDGQGRVLFVHVRSPYSTHDLIDNLLALPIDLKRAMYAEGGPEAQLYVRAGEREMEFVGSHGSSFAVEGASYAFPIPNVIGVRRIEPGPGSQGRPEEPEG